MIWFEPIKQVRALCPEARRSFWAKWHVRHGWFFHAWQYPQGKIIGAFYVTLLCGWGGMIHMEIYDCEFHRCAGDIRAGMRKAIAIARDHLPAVFATIDAENESLRRVLSRFGFREIDRIAAEERSIRLLKYFKPRS